MLPLTGYADRFSVAAGETIAFKVSCAVAGSYQARLVRVISGDPNPAGPGIRERDVPAPFAGSYPSRVQRVPLGSYARVPDAPALQALTSFRAEATIWSTTPATGRQGIIAKWDAATGAGFALWIDARGAGASIGDGRGAAEVEVGRPLRERAWYRVSMSYDAASGALSVRQAPLDPAFGVDDAGAASAMSSLRGAPVTGTPLFIGAMGGEPVGGHFNGKIEAPALLDRRAG
jgi:N,N-dimethylformamidase